MGLEPTPIAAAGQGRPARRPGTGLRTPDGRAVPGGFEPLTLEDGQLIGFIDRERGVAVAPDAPFPAPDGDPDLQRAGPGPADSDPDDDLAAPYHAAARSRAERELLDWLNRDAEPEPDAPPPGEGEGSAAVAQAGSPSAGDAVEGAPARGPETPPLAMSPVESLEELEEAGRRAAETGGDVMSAVAGFARNFDILLVNELETGVRQGFSPAAVEGAPDLAETDPEIDRLMRVAMGLAAPLDSDPENPGAEAERLFRARYPDRAVASIFDEDRNLRFKLVDDSARDSALVRFGRFVGANVAEPLGRLFRGAPPAPAAAPASVREGAGAAGEAAGSTAERMRRLEQLGDPGADFVEIARRSASADPDPFHITGVVPLPARAVNINLARLDTPEDIDTAIAATGRVFRSEIAAARRGVVSNEETRKLADGLGMTVDALLRRRKGQAFNAEEALAARQILASSAQRLVDLAKTARGTGATPEDLVAFRRALALHAAIQSQVSGLTAEAGRALQAFRIEAGATAGFERQVREALDAGGGAEITADLAEHVAALAGDVKGINRFAREAHRATLGDMMVELWINSTLSGPTTHAVNITSNALVAMYQIPERLLAGSIGRVTGSGGVEPGEAAGQIFGLVQGFKDGLKAAGRAMVTGVPSDAASKIETGRFRSLTGENVGLDGPAGRAVDFLGETIRVPGRFLTVEDEFFKGVNRRMELWAQAWRQAEREGITDPQAFSARVRRLVDNPPEEMRLAMEDTARENTFTTPLTSRFGRGVTGIANAHPAVRLVLPFVRTPTNILTFAFKRSPLAPFARSVREDIAAGGVRRDMALARIGMGSMVMAAGVDLAAEGLITGGGPSDPGMRAAWRRTGWQPHSIRLGDTWYAYNRLDPVGMWLGLSADMYEIGQGAEDADLGELATAAVMAVAKNVTSKTWLTGVTNMMEMLEDPDRYGQRYLQGLLAPAVPNFLAQPARARDPVFRDTRELHWWDAQVSVWKERVPGLSDSLPPRRDLWGRVIEGPAGVSALSPLRPSRENPEPIDREMIRLDFSPGMPRRAISGVDLTPEQYSRYVELAGNAARNPATGRGLLDELNRLIGTSQYRRLPDGRKEDAIRSIVSGYRELARLQMFREFPELRVAAEDERRARLEGVR